MYQPLDVLDEANISNYLQNTHPFYESPGNYSRRPLIYELIWVLRSGPDPRPLADDELSRMIAVMDAGGTVLVLGTEQAAVDLARDIVEAMTAGGHA